MVRFTAAIRKFDKQGEKTGWTYVEVPSEIASQICSGTKKSFKVKGKLDACEIVSVSLLPMGDGNYILPLNATLRKQLRKRKGDVLKLQLEVDRRKYSLNEEFMGCLADEPDALTFFNSFSPSTQQYYSKWIESAKMEPTRIKRIAMAINALQRKMEFGPMLREARDKKG